MFDYIMARVCVCVYGIIYEKRIKIMWLRFLIIDYYAHRFVVPLTHLT